jgi:hypothetical protein
MLVVNPPKGGGTKLQGLNASAHDRQLPSIGFQRASRAVERKQVAGAIEGFRMSKVSEKFYRRVSIMKKFLLTAALVLALVTSLTAGTMAFYSAKVETIKSDITTKTFNFTADQNSDSFTKDMRIAPGDTLIYKVKVKNASEVETNSTFTAELDKYGVAFDGLTVSVGLDAPNDSFAKSDTDDTVTISRDMTIDLSDVYTVTVAWAKDTTETGFGATDSARMQGKPIQLRIDIFGKQIGDSETEVMNKEPIEEESE